MTRQQPFLAHLSAYKGFRLRFIASAFWVRTTLEGSRQSKACVLELSPHHLTLLAPFCPLQRALPDAPHSPRWAAPWLQGTTKPSLLQLQVCSGCPWPKAIAILLSELQVCGAVCSPGRNSRLSFPPFPMSSFLWRCGTLLPIHCVLPRPGGKSRAVGGRGLRAC